MISIELVGPARVRGLSCPYCGRAMPLDEAGMVAAQAAWGWCGAVAIAEARPTGLLLVSAATASDPKVTIARIGAAWVLDGHTRRGTGRALLHGLAAGLYRGRVSTVTASSEVARGCGALPAGFLDATGFVRTGAPHTWRLDLNAAVPAPKRSVLGRLGRLVQAVRPVGPPEPARRIR